MKTTAAVAAISVLFSMSANAASFLRDVTGQVFVVRDGVIYSAQENSTLQDGDRVLTQDGSFARIVYDSCNRDVPGKSAVTVIESQLCGAGYQPTSLSRADMAAIRAGTPGYAGTAGTTTVASGGFPLLPVLGVVAGAAALGFALDEDASSP